MIVRVWEVLPLCCRVSRVAWEDYARVTLQIQRGSLDIVLRRVVLQHEGRALGRQELFLPFLLGLWYLRRRLSVLIRNVIFLFWC